MNNSTTDTDEYLKSLPEWQKINLAAFRQLIHKVSQDVTEEIKWGVPVFIYKGKTLFSLGSFKAHSKYNFMYNGAELDDKHELFNNGLESKKSRSIDLQQGETINLSELEDLIKQSVSKL